MSSATHGDVDVPGSASPDDWDSHWAEYGESAGENPAQAYRRRLILRLLDLTPTDRLVDIGSGQGDMAAELRAAHPSVAIMGLELGASGIAQAQRKVPDARFVQTDLLQAQSPDPADEGWGTAAVCSEVLEHVDDPSLLLRNASTYLAPGARLVITVPGGPRSAFDRYIGHRRHFDARSITEVIEGAGLRTERVLKAGFPFFNLYRLAVVARGDKLILDVRAGADMEASGAGALLRAFGVAYRANLTSSPLGWQIVAVATVPPAR